MDSIAMSISMLRSSIPWAVRFRRNDEPVYSIVREYERAQWLLGKENSDLRELVNQMRNEIATLNRQIDTLGHQWNDHISGLEQNATWRMLQRLQAVRKTIIPPGSRRGRWLTRLLYHRS
jgi:hypothetical protein